MKRRVFYVDVVRAFACLLVVMSHVFAPVCAAINHYPRPVWWIFNLFDSFIRPSAALYVMISGKLFLGSSREDSYLQFVWKRYSRVFLPFFTWSMIYAFYNAREEGTPWAPGLAVLQFLKGPTEYHLWFMYLILGLYLVMPAMRRFVRWAPPQGLAGALALWMGFLVVNFLFPGYARWGFVTILLSYGGYAILGYALDKANTLHPKTGVALCLCAGIVVFNAAATYVSTIRRGGTLDERFYFGAAPLVALQAAAMFLLLKNVDEDSFAFKNARLRAVVTRLGRNSYNIYLNHALFIWLFTQGTLGFILSHNTGSSPWVGVPLTGAAVLACSLGLTLLLQRIPIISTLFVITPPLDSGTPITGS